LCKICLGLISKTLSKAHQNVLQSTPATHKAVDAATYCTRAAKKRHVIFSAHGANSERPAPALRHEGRTRARVDRQHPWSDLSARFYRALSYPVFSSVNKLSDAASLAKVPYFYVDTQTGRQLHFLNFPPWGGDSYLRHSPPLASVIFALPPFFLSLPVSPWRIRPTPDDKSSVNCRLKEG
jgi:hypothetical protein